MSSRIFSLSLSLSLSLSIPLSLSLARAHSLSLSSTQDIISLDCHYACRILVKMTKSAQLLCPHSSSANQALENHKLRRIASQLCLGRDTPESLVPSCNVPSRTPRSGVSFLVVSLSLALYRSPSLSLSLSTHLHQLLTLSTSPNLTGEMTPWESREGEGLQGCGQMSTAVRAQWKCRGGLRATCRCRYLLEEQRLSGAEVSRKNRRVESPHGSWGMTVVATFLGSTCRARGVRWRPHHESGSWCAETQTTE